MKKIVIMCVLVLFVISNTFAQFDEQEKIINEAATSFMSDFSTSLINATTNQNVYADAYIGKLFPSVPPHFAVGLNASIAQLEMGELSSVVSEINDIVETANSALGGNALGIKELPETAVLPLFTADARLGGVFLPFDIGVSFMRLKEIDFFGINLDYTTVGADLRYAVLQENLLLPNISIGAAYYYTTGSIAVSEDVASFTLNNKMKIASLSAQVSKSFLFVTPFIGARFSMIETENNFDWNVSVIGQSISGNPEYNKDLTELYSTNVYAGLSFNILVLKITPSVSYDFNNEIITGAFSLKAQL